MLLSELILFFVQLVLLMSVVVMAAMLLSIVVLRSVSYVRYQMNRGKLSTTPKQCVCQQLDEEYPNWRTEFFTRSRTRIALDILRNLFSDKPTVQGKNGRPPED